jgi:hypothetical protein
MLFGMLNVNFSVKLFSEKSATTGVNIFIPFGRIGTVN